MDLEVVRCKNCGGTLDLTKARNGVVECAYCGSKLTVPKTIASSDALDSLRQGEHDLDTCKFDDAYTAFAKAAEYDKSEPEAYFGMALAEFKVQYLKDEVADPPRLQPICHEISDKKFKENKNYKKALDLATAEQRTEYIKKAGEIDDIRVEFNHLKKEGLDYDCFICVKVSGENGGTTQDSHEALRLYNYLKSQGYAPFYSEEEIKGRTGSAYEALILYALYTSECMLIVCFDENYLHTKWVKNEYMRFSKMMASEEKERNAISFVYKGTPIERLPGQEKRLQGIDLSKPDAYSRIEKYVSSFAPININGAPEIQRKEYKGASYAKKTAVRGGVTKRQLTSVNGGEITVSARAQMNIAAEFLARKDFTNAIRQCDMILSANSANSETHWMRFLAQHRSVDGADYALHYNGESDFEHLEKAIASCNDPSRSWEMYNFLFEHAKRRKSIQAYQEFITLPDSSETKIAELTSIMYDYAMDHADADIFREIIKTVTDTDRYISMNQTFAAHVSPQAAVEFYKNVLEADEGDSEALYKVFAAEHGYTDEAVFAFCSQKDSYKEVEEKLFAYGYNASATRTLFRQCLAHAATATEESSNLASFLFAMIPKEANQTFLSLVQEYIDTLISCGKMDYAARFNELLLTEDKLSHDAYFNRVLIKHGFRNPLELVKIADTLMEDADFFSAVNSFTERHPTDKNLYLDIHYAVKELRGVLNTSRRLNYVPKTTYVSKMELLSCTSRVQLAAAASDHTGPVFTAKEYSKTAVLSLPAILFFVLSLLAVRSPQLIDRHEFNTLAMPLLLVGGGVAIPIFIGISTRANDHYIKAVILSLPSFALSIYLLLAIRYPQVFDGKALDFGSAISLLIAGFGNMLTVGLMNAGNDYRQDPFVQTHIRLRSAIILTLMAAYGAIMSCAIAFAG